MDRRQEHIIDDLSGEFKGEVRCDEITGALYASDAGLYQIKPLGVAWPRDREDVALLARYAAENNLPLIARGAGTGLAGGAVGEGLIVDFSRHMRRVIAIDGNTVRVQPGIVRDELNQVLKKHERYFAPDPSNTAVTTIGGMAGVDAAGSRSMRVGSMRDHVQSIQVVLAGGETLEFATESPTAVRAAHNRTGPELGDLEKELARVAHPDTRRTIISKLARLLGDHEELIHRHQPALPRNCSGYYLRGVLRGDSLALPRLLIGSEGTLGLFTELTLHTSPLPAHRGVVLALFADLEAAVRAVRVIAGQQPSACDLLDRRLLSLAREADDRFAMLISPAAEAALLIEQTGYSTRQARDRIRMVVDALETLSDQIIDTCEAYTSDDVEFLWSLPEKVVPLLTRLHGTSRPVPFVEDVAVPPESMHDFLLRTQRVFQKHEVTSTLYAHAAAGQVHLRPFLPTPTPEMGRRLQALAGDLYEEVFAVGGTISGEHGDGLSRSGFIRRQYGSLYPLFQQIKDLFDPHNLLNPGKIVNDDPDLMLTHIRPPTPPVPEAIELQLQWSPQELTDATLRCNSCGICRTQSSELRMCPFFRADPAEENSPRAKANLLRNAFNGVLTQFDYSSETAKQLADLCFNCKQCQLECPSNVNIPQMMIEAKAAYVATNGLTRADWILSRAHSFSMLTGWATPLINWGLDNPISRWCTEKLLGIARKRKLPRFARRSYLESMAPEYRDASLLRDPEGSVVYFLGEYANFYDPQLAEAFVAVLEYHGIHVHIPEGQTGTGMAMISAGDLEPARRLAERNLRELGDLARDGYSIVCTEPTVAVCLKQEYPMLVDHPDAAVVAERVVEAGDYLDRLQRQDRLKTDFESLDMNIGYHTPCHLKALGKGTPLLNILSLNPGLNLHRIEEGCSGMAGAFGLTKQNFETSLQLGQGLISRMQQPDLDIGVTECSSCKMQMEQGTTTPTLHPIKLLALSYGLLPEIRQKLQPNRGKLTVS